MFNKKTIDDINVKGKKVIVRVDFNVPIEDGKITDDTRIRAALPTIQTLLDRGAAVILMSHLGRPKGKDMSQSLRPIAEYLSKLINKPVTMAPDTIGPEVKKMADELKPGQIMMLENTRFYPEEEGSVKTEGLSEEEAKKRKSEMKAKQKEMAKALASLADIYVNDAFGTAHRAHASTAVIADYMKTAVAGYLMAKEIQYLGEAVANPKRPFVAIIGGAKVSGKLEVLRNLLTKCDVILIGGGMAYTFLKAKGEEIGNSLCEDELLDVARETLEAAKKAKIKFLLPVDHVAADRFAADANIKICDQVPTGWMGLDIGPKTIQLFAEEIKKAKTIVWNGPMGCFEMEPFAKGTMEICKAVADSGAVSIIGGGDSVSAVNQSGLADKMTHISTGGGASLEFLEGKILPGVACLQDRE